MAEKKLGLDPFVNDIVFQLLLCYSYFKYRCVYEILTTSFPPTQMESEGYIVITEVRIYGPVEPEFNITCVLRHLFLAVLSI